MDCIREVSFANQLAEITRLAEFVEAFGEECGLATSDVFKVNLVLDELMTNVISYGYQDAAAHEIRLRLSLADGRLTAVLTDDGNPFDPITSGPKEVASGSVEARPIGGLGLHFMRKMMDEVRYERVGGRNQLTLVRYVGGPDGTSGAAAAPPISLEPE
jgi:anti-sigma regulatory factor (Ser/Thr protein kinase)